MPEIDERLSLSLGCSETALSINIQMKGYLETIDINFTVLTS